VGESDPIERPEPDPADAADGVSSDEVKAGPRLALISAVAPTPPAGTSTLPSEQLARLADRTAAALALPTPAVDHEQQLPAEALARVLDAVEASTAAARKRAYRSDWGPVRRLGRRRGIPPAAGAPRRPGALRHRGAAEQTGVGSGGTPPADLAAAVADGADCVAGIGALGDQEAQHGPVASVKTAWRLIDGGVDAGHLAGVKAARAAARCAAWAAGAAPPGVRNW